MFTVTDRTALRDRLVAAARADARVTGAAVTGSGAVGLEDEWSDIDLALAVAADADAEQVVADWTERLYREYGAVHHVDVIAGATLFRVFLLADTLQVDLAFWPEAEFGPTGRTFRLLFGTAVARPPASTPDPTVLIGMAWLYALHARSSIARGRGWQAEYLISGVRERVVALMCLRHDLPAVQGRGVDSLPAPVTAALATTLVGSLDAAELRRAMGAVVGALQSEIAHVDPGLAGRLAGPLRELTAF